MAERKHKQIYKKAMKAAKSKNPNNEAVFELLKAAYKEGSGDAAAAIANWYVHGIYVRKNARTAVSWFSRSAKLGSGEGYHGLAVSFQQGSGGVKKSQRKAYEYYVAAALRGEESSLREVGRCLWYGYGVKLDKTLAEIWLARADELGVPDDGSD